jgi:glycosyltransferase involved in cell wall biosynthesis
MQSRTRLNVAIVAHAASGGGAERVACVLANGLAERGHKVSIFVEHNNPHVMHLHPAIKFTLLKGRSRLSRLWNLTKQFRAERYDVVHTINPLLTLEAMIATACSRSSSTKLIGSYHGYCHISSSHGLLANVSYLLTPLLTRGTDGNVCVSEALKADLVRRWGAKPNNLTMIYNPVLIPGSSTAGVQGKSTASSTLPSDYILYVGRLSRVKNPTLALRALALLPERLSRFNLIMLGDGPLRGELEGLARSLNIFHRVIFVNYVSDPSEYYRGAKAFISTSYRESFGLALVEAMAYGVSVVSTRSGGPQEILADGRFGTLIPIGDEKGLATAIMHAIDKPLSSKILVGRSAEFSVDRAVLAYEELFSRVTGHVTEPIGSRPAL